MKLFPSIVNKSGRTHIDTLLAGFLALFPLLLAVVLIARITSPDISSGRPEI